MNAPVGAPVRRKEDFRFLTGKGTYTDDINRPGQLYAVFVRSPQAHADIVRIDTGPAKAAPGVIAVYTGADLQAAGMGTLPCGWAVKSKDGSPMAEPPHPVLALGRVRHVGDPVAVVIAETKSQAQEAAERVDVDLQIAPGRGLGRRCGEAGTAARLRRGRRQHLLRLAHRRQGRDRRRLRQGGARDAARHRQQPPHRQRDGAARLYRRVRPRHRRLHALHHEPESARHPAA